MVGGGGGAAVVVESAGEVAKVMVPNLGLITDV